MLITEVDYPKIRRLEAVGFRSLPAKSIHFNGSWAVRQTPNSNTKRLNSINPLDPADILDFEERLSREEIRFKNIGKPPIFRLTPLASPSLRNYLAGLGWISFEESLLMTLKLDELDLSKAKNQLPFQNTEQWVRSSLELENKPASLLLNKIETLNSVKAQTGFFLTQTEGKDPQKPCAALRCVVNKDLLGIFSLATNAKFQRRGHARQLLLNSFLWAQRNGAKLAWLQVVGDNKPAISLYQSMGFREFYRYIYYKPSVA